MFETVVPNDSKLPSLQAIVDQRPTKLMAQVRWAWTEINAALKAGHTLKIIHENLCQDGIQIGYSTLARYISRIRCEQARHNLRVGNYAGGSALKPQHTLPANYNPLANAMAALSKPRYSVREAMCDGDPTRKKLV